MRSPFCWIAALVGLLGCSETGLEPDPSIDCAHCAAWNEPLGAFQVFGNTYYVGTAGLSSILIDSSEGLLLIDGALPQSATQIVANIDSLGFDARDIRIIAASHAHYDHVGGIAALQRLTGAEVVAGADAVRMLENGRSFEDDPQFGPDMSRFPPITDVIAADTAEPLTLGNVAVRAVSTPGHSPGGTSWTWQSCEGERCLDIVYADSLSAVSAPGYRFGDGMGVTIRESAAALATLDCDILLSTHDFSFGLHEKLAAGRETFVDTEACWAYAEAVLARLERRLDAEKATM